MYGWVRAGADGRVQAVSVKVPFSEAPLADHVISGCFWFRTAALMTEGIDELIRSNRRVNHEFYMDSVPERLLARGHGVGVFEVDKYIGWGTPDDLEDYQRWERYFAHRRVA